MSKVVVVGSLNQDVVVNVEAAPGPGETVLGRSLEFFQGGKGANQAVAARRSGARTVFVGRIGDDDFGRSLNLELEKSGIETRIAVDPEAPTGTAVILVDRNGENRIAVVLGANGRVGVEEVEHLEMLDADDVLLLQHEIPLETNRRCAAIARRRGARVVVNAAPAQEYSAEDLEPVDVLVANEHELRAVFGKPGAVGGSREDAVAEAREAAAAGGLDVVLTLGSAGAIGIEGGRVHDVPGREVAPVDTTGAGDCLTGAFVAALANGQEFGAALAFANAAAALSVTRPGAAASFPDLETVRRHASG